MDKISDQERYGNYHLFIHLKELSRKDYMKLYGEKSLAQDPITAVCERLGRVTINLKLLEPGILQVGDRILISLFAGELFEVKIKNVNEAMITDFGGEIQGAKRGNLFLSVSENKVLATIEQPGENSIYLVRFNPESGEHYLFEAPLDKVERLPY